MTPAIPLRAKFPLSTLDDRARTDVWSTCDGGSPRSSPRPGLYRRTKSAPSSPHAQEFGPPPRRRVRSHEISALKFGASFAIKQAAPEFPRVLEVTVTWRSKPQIYAFELRRLVFWFVVVAFLLLPASGLKITPVARALASHGGPRATTAVRRLVDKSNEVKGVAGELLAEAPVLDEISGLIVKESTDTGVIGADDGTLVGLVGHIARWVHSGELSMQALRSTATRACISALMHKAVGAAMSTHLAQTVLDCVPHAHV